KVTISHSLKFCGGGTVYLRTSGFASFASVKTPRGSGSITGIYSEFGSQRQLMVRDTNDVQFNQNRCIFNGPAVLFYEDFEQVSSNSALSIPQWANLAESGNQFYQIQSFQNNRVASITALGTNETAVTSWLILPAIQLNNSSGEQLSFLTRDAFDNGAGLQILLSNNYDGKGQPWKAKWSSLNANIAKGAVGGVSAVFTKSGNINLSNYAGWVHIAFKYTGSDTGPLSSRKNTNYWVDDVKITAQ
ncbi:MAG: choice-of-anchor J domain-containing protein, partial [Sediminibacterium sp.]|nr:choice-of-anchor J domain-containing protein [Sediminibacterium sp.]